VAVRRESAEGGLELGEHDERVGISGDRAVLFAEGEQLASCICRLGKGTVPIEEAPRHHRQRMDLRGSLPPAAHE
jgi:hypothetical protein